MCKKKGGETKEYVPAIEKYKAAVISPDDPIKKGPYEDDQRQCRDCACLIIFLIFLIGIIAVAYLGFYYGDPDKIMYPFDANKRQCGRKYKINGKDYEDYKYLYFYNFIDDTIKLSENIFFTDSEHQMGVFCVKSCEPISQKGDNYIMDCIPVKSNVECKVTRKNFYDAIPSKFF